MDNSLGTQHHEMSSLLFRVQAQLCALPAAQVVETMRPLPIKSFAGAPTAVKGVAIIRGVPIPVVELAALLGGAANLPARFVTVRADTGHIALAVDSVLGLSYIPTSSLQALPKLLGAADNDAVSAIGTLDAELLLVLSAARLLPDNAWPLDADIDADGAAS